MLHRILGATMSEKIVTGFLAGIVLGMIGARYLFVGSAMSLIPWSIVGAGLGAWGREKGWVPTGLVYGFTLYFAFMVAGYTGEASLLSRVPFFAVIAVIGAVFGFLSAWAGAFLGRKIIRKPG